MYYKKYCLSLIITLIMSSTDLLATDIDTARDNVQGAFDIWKKGKTPDQLNEILNYVDSLADTIENNPGMRESNIQNFNVIVSTGLAAGISLNATEERRNRLYETVVNKVAPHITDDTIWASHEILNVVPLEKAYTKNQRNQWRALKRIYRQVNDPRFFAKYPDKVNINGGAHYHYNVAIAKQVLKETITDGQYVTPSGRKKKFKKPAASAQLVVNPDDTTTSIKYTLTHQDNRIENKRIKENSLDSKDFSKVRILHVDTFEAAYEMMIEDPTLGGNVAVVNFANEISIGGGFLGGAAAQEEELCRRSNLYSQLRFYRAKDKLPKRERYETRIPAFGAIMSPNVTVYKGRDFTNLENPYNVMVITSAADDLKKSTLPLKEAQHSDENKNRTRHKIRSHIACAVEMGAKVLVTGAFGAGAFLQDPDVIAEIYAEELKKFGGYFDRIVFAIISPYRDNNYKFFAEKLSQLLPGVQIYDNLEPQSFFIEKIGGNETLRKGLNFEPMQKIIADRIERTLAG